MCLFLAVRITTQISITTTLTMAVAVNLIYRNENAVGKIPT